MPCLIERRKFELERMMPVRISVGHTTVSVVGYYSAVSVQTNSIYFSFFKNTNIPPSVRQEHELK